MGSLVGSVGNLLGGGSGNNAGFQAQGANIIQPTTIQDVAKAHDTAVTGLQQQQHLINALANQNGIQNQANVFNQLQGVANGQGPNPAQAMLNQQTGQNIANQAALMAGQRGAGANAGLLAREAAQQGGALQQNAVGQGAALQANQSLNALGQLGGLAGQQVAQQQGALQNYNQLAQGEQGQLLNALQGFNTNNVGMQSNINTANAGLASTNANNTGQFLSGGINSIGGAAAKLAGFAKGGEVAPNPKIAAVAPSHRFSGVLEPHIQHMAHIYHPDKFSKGGKVNALVSPGEVYLPPEKAKDVAKGKANPLKEGTKVPGKAEVKGDSEKNDKVPAKLEEGGIVIPRSVLQSKNPGEAAAKFVEDHLKEKGSGDEHADFKSALKKAILNRKSK